MAKLIKERNSNTVGVLKNFKIGERVMHITLGAGTVVKESNGSTKITVKFDDPEHGTTKSFVNAFSKIESEEGN